MAIIQAIEHLVKPPLKISALGAVAAQGERSLVGIGGRLALVRPKQQFDSDGGSRA